MSDELPSAVKVLPGVSIYKVKGAQYWYVRVWNSQSKKYIVKSTGETSAINAKLIAKEHALALGMNIKTVEPEYRFRYFASEMLKKMAGLVRKGEINIGYSKAMQWAVENEEWGLGVELGALDVRKITTRDFLDFMNKLSVKRPELSSSTRNTIMATFRNVMKVAREDGAIDAIPETPRSRQKDNPRPFFRFHPLVSKADDAYQMILQAAKDMVDEQVTVRGISVTDELYDILLFLTHSFVRPISSELYAIRHSDITIADDPKRLIVTVRDGKTGYRAANTMPAAVSVYERILIRYPNKTADDYIFLPDYENRVTASKIIQRQFAQLMARSGMNIDKVSGKAHSLYSLRHTAICMRIINSEGQVNIFNLAKNAGTSVDQIERFYARFLPLSKEMARNLQSFG